MSLNYKTLEPGDIVSYGDIVNRRVSYVVVCKTAPNAWGQEWLLVNMETGYRRTSDCRQAMWELESTNPLAHLVKAVAA
jgi:hypothetical protein